MIFDRFVNLSWIYVSFSFETRGRIYIYRGGIYETIASLESQESLEPVGV